LSAQDTTPPVAAVVSPVDGAYLNSLPSIAGTAADDVAVTEVQLKVVRQSDDYFWDGAVFVAAETWLTASFADPAWSYAVLPAWVSGSSYTVIARAQDSSANWSAAYSTSVFHFDAGLPASAVLVPASGSAPAAFSGISGTAWDNESFAAQAWVKLVRVADNMHWNGATSQWTVPEVWNLAIGSATWTWPGPAQAALTAGATYFAVSRAQDLAGNVQTSELQGSTFVYAGATVVVTPADIAPEDPLPAGKLALGIAKVSLYQGEGMLAAVPAPVPMLRLTLQTTPAGAPSPRLQSLQVKSSGTLSDADIKWMGLYADHKTIGILGQFDGEVVLGGQPTDILIASASYSGGAWDFTGLNVSDSTNSLITNSPRAFFLGVRVSTSAAAPRSFGLVVASSTFALEGSSFSVLSGNNFPIVTATSPVRNMPGALYAKGTDISAWWQPSALPAGQYGYAAAGSDRVGVLKLEAWTDGFLVRLNRLRIIHAGTGVSTDVAHARLFMDAVSGDPTQGDGIFSPALDKEITDPGNPPVVDGGDPTSFLLPVLDPTLDTTLNWSTRTYFVVYDISTAAQSGLTHGARLEISGVNIQDGVVNFFSPIISSNFAVTAVDNQAPTAAILAPAHLAYLNSLPLLHGTAADNVAVASVTVAVLNMDAGLYWDGSTWGAGSVWLDAAVWPSSWTYANVPAWVEASSYVVTARTRDTSGNWSLAYSTAVFTYDITPPAGAITAPLTGTYAAFSSISGTAADAHGVTQVLVNVTRQLDYSQWDGAAWAAGPQWILATGTSAWNYAGINSAALDSGATYSFTIRVLDAAGNASDPMLGSSTFTYILPPAGALSGGNFSGVGVNLLTVNWTSSYPGGTPYFVRLSTVDSAAAAVYLATSAAVSVSFSGLVPDTSYYGFVSTYAASGFVSGGFGRTLAAAPASAAFSGVGYSSASLSWPAGLNPAGTVYQYELSESDIFSVFTASGSGAVLNAVFTGLSQGTTYYGRARAVNGDGVATAYAEAAVPAVTAVLLPSGLVSGLSGTVLGVSSIAWAWTSGSVSAADYFAVYSGLGVALSTEPFALSSAYSQGGLGPNSAQVLRVAGRNERGEGPLAESAAVYTLAMVPAGPVSDVALTSAAITLGLNGNPAGTVLQLWRSADNLSFDNIFEGTDLSYSDASLAECSAYYYKSRARNGAGVYTAFSGALAFTTMASTPAAPGGLYAEAQDGARLTLGWEPSPSAGVLGYSVYYDNAAGAVDYAAPLAVFSSTVTAWTTPALTAGSTYKFAVRANGACGAQEKNTSLLASAQAVGVLSGVRAAIKVPQTGKRVTGNRITVVAEIILGLPSQVAQVRFQYSPAGAGAWTDIPAANINNPNPDFEAPYFTHLDADAMAPGAYDLRAVAADVYGAADPAAPSVTIVIDTVNYDINESETAGEQRKEQKINNTVSSTVQAADDVTALLTKLVIPSGAVVDSTVAVTMVNNPAAVPAPPSGADSLNLAVKVNLSNGQSQFSSGKTATLSFTYKDDDGNGIVDGTLAAVDRLRVYSASDSGGAWSLLATSVDKEKKTVTAVTPHFSFFSVFAAPASGLGSLKVYPVPWQPGTGGRFDSAQGVTFSGLPAAAKIKIFTLVGELVRLLEVSAADAGFKVWDGRNSEGHKAASGIYIALVKSGSDERTVKVAVER